MHIYDKGMFQYMYLYYDLQVFVKEKHICGSNCKKIYIWAKVKRNGNTSASGLIYVNVGSFFIFLHYYKKIGK